MLIWDGASYHRSKEFRNYLEMLNGDRVETEWLLKCLRLAPNAPQQNPIEDIWLQGKRMLRRFWHLCNNFTIFKWLFEWFITNDIFLFPQLSMYGKCSSFS